MQSLLRDIAKEMEGIDKTTAMMVDAATHQYLVELADKKKKS